MTNKLNTYTVSIYTENNIGLLNRISAIFLKRHVNIESLTTSQSEIDNIYRFVIVVKVVESKIKNIVKQIEKQIEVIAAFYHTDKETIFLDLIALRVPKLYTSAIVLTIAVITNKASIKCIVSL